MLYSVEEARRLRNISQQKMAEYLGICKTAYINKELGLSRFYIDEAVKFANAVNLPLESINFFTNVVP